MASKPTGQSMRADPIIAPQTGNNWSAPMQNYGLTQNVLQNMTNPGAMPQSYAPPPAQAPAPTPAPTPAPATPTSTPLKFLRGNAMSSMLQRDLARKGITTEEQARAAGLDKPGARYGAFGGSRGLPIQWSRPQAATPAPAPAQLAPNTAPSWFTPIQLPQQMANPGLFGGLLGNY